MRRFIRDQISHNGDRNENVLGEQIELPSAILQRIEKGYFNSHRKRAFQPDLREPQETPIGSRRRARKRVVLDLSA